MRTLLVILALGLAFPALASEPTFQPGSRQPKTPQHITGTLVMGSSHYKFGSGGLGYGSIPYGDFPVTPTEIGPWGSRHDAIGVNHNALLDPKYKAGLATRDGIEIHSNFGHGWRTFGCLGIDDSQWRVFRQELFAMISTFGQAWLHISPDGAAITASSEAPPPSTLIALDSTTREDISPSYLGVHRTRVAMLSRHGNHVSRARRIGEHRYAQIRKHIHMAEHRDRSPAHHRRYASR